MRPIKVDYYLPPIDLGTVAYMASWAKSVGYDGLFSSDTAHEPFLPIVSAATAAPGMDFGTAIAVAFARSPMVVAQTAWDLASFTGGKFLLGLGTQIKPHVERRFSMPWHTPGPQLREFITAMRTVWNCWQTGEKLNFDGDYYSLNLMMPFFDPGPIAFPEVPVYIAGVGPYMARLAGETCDGYHVHPFHSVRYLEEVTFPAMDEGAAKAGRTRQDLEVACTVFAVTGRDDSEIAEMRQSVKQQIAFYASTPAYRGMLDVHGWDFGPQLTAMSKRGEWSTMAEVIPDEAVADVAVEAPLDELGQAVRERYEGLVDRLGYYTFTGSGGPDSDDSWSSLISDTRG